MTKNRSTALLIEPCDFIEYPVGGQLSFARQMIRVFGNRLALVGWSTDDTPVGKWTTKAIDGIEYDYFAYHKKKDISSQRPIVPARITDYLALNRWKNAIQQKQIPYVFLRSQHLLVNIVKWKVDNICYYFPGIENPLSISRYLWAKSLAKLFDTWFLPRVSKANTVLAAADTKAIEELVCRSKGKLDSCKIHVFPTRVDTDIFCYKDKHLAKKYLGIPESKIVISTTGRIHWAKGWKLILGAFKTFNQKFRDSILCFVGDGQDRPNLEAEISKLNLDNNVIITGFLPPERVSDYLKATDIFILGSKKEGWSTSLVEALATCLPIVSTDVSSSNTIIKEGVNGFVVKHRTPDEFFNAFVKALKLDTHSVMEYSREEIEKYALKYLEKDLGRIWKPLAESP